MKYALSAIVLLALTAVSDARAQVVPITHYTPDSELTPLPSAEVYGLYQDSGGYMWFAVYSSGLVRYDGHEMRVYTTEDGLPHLTVRSMVQGGDGRLWVSSDGGLAVSALPLHAYPPNSSIRFTTTVGSTDLVDVAIRQKALVVDKQGNIWVGTEGSGIFVYSFDGDSLGVNHISTDIGRGHEMAIESIVSRSDGSVWATAEEPDYADLLIFPTGSMDFDLVSTNTTLPTSFSTISEDRNGRLWGGTADGYLWYIDPDSETPALTFLQRRFPDEIVSITAESDSVLWLAAEQYGLVRVLLTTPPVFDVFGRRNGLLDENVHDTFVDRENNLWLSQSGGVSKLRANRDAFKNYTADSHTGELPMLPASSVSAVVLPPPERRSTCDVIAGTAAGISCLNGGQLVGHLNSSDGLRSDFINAIAHDQLGRLWVGTDDGISGVGLDAGARFPSSPAVGNARLGSTGVRIHNYRRTTIHSASTHGMRESASNPKVRESVWMPGYYSLYLLLGNDWYVFRPAAGLPPTHYQTVAFDTHGHLLVGTRDYGLYRSIAPLTVESLRKLRMEESATVLGDRPGVFGYEIVEPVFEPVWNTTVGSSPTNQIMSLVVKDDLILAGSPIGLFVLDGSPLFISERVTRQSGLPDNNVLSMAVSPVTGNIWAGTNGGLAEIDTRTRNVIRTVTKSDGLIDNEVWYLGSVFVDEDGKVYYGTAKGLSIYDPDADKPNLVPAKPQITGVRYRESPWGNNEFAIEYAALSFAREKEVEYKTRLVPYETEWSAPTKDHRIRYTNLPAFFADRDYTFELQASNGSGVWTQQPISYSFSVTPAWYIRWWALLSYLLLVGGGVFAYIRHKTRIQAEQLAQEREINERLRRIDRLKDEFLANTSHELRTPLNGIIGIAESMMDGVAGDLGHKAMSNIALIIASGKRLANLVNDILDFSKLKERELELRRKAVDVSVLGDIVLRVSEPLIEGKNLILKNTIPRDLPPAYADEDRLQQILYNLIGNAIKFTHEGSVILSGRSGDGIVEIGVADTGIGIPKEKHDAIFQSFEQVDASTGREYGGTGLGLAVTRQLVELHGGKIRVESTENVGSTFLFTLPVSDGEAEELEATEYLSRIATPEPGPGSPSGASESDVATTNAAVVEDNEVHVLVVDDEPINQQVMANQLSVANYSVTQAMNGMEALKALEGDTSFDIVLLDVMMPRMSGFEVCNRIRKNFLPSELPIIMVTAKNQVADLVEGLSAGANDYITKPISKSELLARIKTQLNLQRINRAYGRFVPREFLRYLNRESIIDVKLGDMVQKEMTIFVSDIRKFTTLSEMMTPEENFEFINAYLAQASPVIRDHGGFIDRYTGDAIMALFPEEADEAVQASIDTLRILEDINRLRVQQDELPIEIGIGLHSGSLMLGIVGERERAQGDIFSDAVNLANRIEGLSKLYGASLVVSEETLGRLGSNREYHERFLGKVQVKGKNEHVSVFEIYDGDPEHMIELKLRTKNDFEEGLDHYFNREFTNASVCFKKVLDQNGDDKTAALYLRRSAQFMIQGVPDTWEGVEAVDEISEGLPAQSATRTTSTPPASASRHGGGRPSGRSTVEKSDSGSNGNGRSASSGDVEPTSPATAGTGAPSSGDRGSESGTLTKRSVIAAPDAISGDGGSVVESSEPLPEGADVGAEVPTLIDPDHEVHRESEEAGSGTTALPREGVTKKKKDKKKRKKKHKASKKGSKGKKKKEKEKKKEKKGKREKSLAPSSKAGKRKKKGKKK